MRLSPFVCSLVLGVVLSRAHAQTVNAPFLPVSSTPAAGALPLATDGTPTRIYHDPQEPAVVDIAAHALADDFERVTGRAVSVTQDAAHLDGNVVLIGTLGHSAMIDGLAARGKLDVSKVRGQWEAYTATVLDDPTPGVPRALVIAGSDRRGTAYGVFGLSEAMGVSPWYWWADVTPTKQAALCVAPGTYTEPSPGVKYRGIFLNDEDWGLQPWAAKTFEPETGDIGPKTYAKVFELLLRLHANFVWPAMHDCTRPFDTFPQNKVVADQYAIVMGSSHHEPMLRDTSEYDARKLGPYNYWTNRWNIYNFWDERVKENAAYENVYTVGMRGNTDDGIISPPGTTLQGKVEEMQNFIIPDQRKMLAEHVGPPATVPQIFVPYKEALLQYQAGLQVPDDVTLVWPDDNHGYIRELPTAEERKRSGGSGVYYHLSYWGSPKDYLWLCTTPPAVTWEEMSKAWDYDARRLWIVNIGDLKPGEIGLDFFLRLARHPEDFRDFDQDKYLQEWSRRTFGPKLARSVTQVLANYYRLNFAVRPEHLNPTRSGFSFTQNGWSSFWKNEEASHPADALHAPLVAAGWREGRERSVLCTDEAQARLDQFDQLVRDAETVAKGLPANLQDAYYQLVLYPVRCSALMNRKVLDAERSRLYAVQGRAASVRLGQTAQAAFDAIQSETAHYNGGIANGKWNRMMSAHPHPTKNDVFERPEVGRYVPPAEAGLGVVVEGSSRVLGANTPGILPTFHPALGLYNEAFVDVFNTGTNPLDWTAQADVPWIALSQTQGNSDARLLVAVDEVSANRIQLQPGASAQGTVTIRGAGEARTIRVTASAPAQWKPWADHVESNGRVKFPADRYQSKQEQAGVGWEAVRSGGLNSPCRMMILPTTAASFDLAKVPTDAPSLTYHFSTFDVGPTTVRTACLPTHHINAEHPGVRYAVSLNGDAPQIVNVDADEWTPTWDKNVLRATAYGVSHHTITAPGAQELKVYMVDPGVVLDRFEVEVGYKPGGEFEAEDLPAAAASGKPFRVFADAPSSGGAAVAYEAVNPGDQFTVALSNLQAGAYDVAVRVKELDNRGKVRLSVADTLAGPYTDFGEEMDLYSPQPAYVEFATNRLNLASPGTKFLRFTVTGHNPANTTGKAWVAVDRVTLTPVAPR